MVALPLTFIRIDLSSLKPHPQAGETCTLVRSGPGLCEIAYRWGTWRSIGTFAIESMNRVQGRFRRMSQEGTLEADDPQTFEEVRSFSLDDPVRVLARDFGEVHRLYHDPLPAWLFHYEDPTLTCEWCSGTFLLSQLTFSEWDESPTADCCPHCLVGDCCPVRYETVDEALRRAGRLNPRMP